MRLLVAIRWYLLASAVVAMAALMLYGGIYSARDSSSDVFLISLSLGLIFGWGNGLFWIATLFGAADDIGSPSLWTRFVLGCYGLILLLMTGLWIFVVTL